MPQKKITQSIFSLRAVRELSFEQKVIALGGLLSIISVFFPWYQDVDRFGTGFTFLGITGPLYLVGVLFFVAGALALGTVLNAKVKQKILNFGFKLTNFYYLSAGFLLFLLILTNSVYFHENFGVNITAKEFRFGMILAFMGTGLLLLGAFFQRNARSLHSLDADIFETPSSPSRPLVEYPDRSHQDIQPRTIEDAMKEHEEQGKIEL